MPATDPTSTPEFLLGKIDSKLDALTSQITASEQRTDKRLSKVEADLVALGGKVDELQADKDRRAGVLRVPVVVWAVMGPVATGVTVAVLVRLLGG